MVQHGYELDENQQGEGQEEHEAQRVDVHVLSGELQVAVHFWHLDVDGLVQELQSESRYEPEGVTDEVDEGDLWREEEEFINTFYCFFI